jgi:hypothetical protein
MAETEQPGVIVAVDPGGTTGIAWWKPNAPEGTSHYGTEQVPACDTEGGLRSLLYHVGVWLAEATPAYLVVERFEFRQEDSQMRSKIDYTAAEVIGALRALVCDRQGVTLVKQGAAQAKGFWTDDKIQKLALWVPGQKHAMDAMRHLLAHRLFVLGDKKLLDPFRPVRPAAPMGQSES